MNTKPWLISAIVLLGLTLALWSDVRAAVSFGGNSWDMITFAAGPVSPNWDFLTFSSSLAGTSAKTTGSSNSVPTPASNVNNAPVAPLMTGNIPYVNPVNVFPAPDKTKTPATTIVALLDTNDAKAMQDQLIPKEGGKSPSGLTFSLDTFEQQKNWSRDITPDPAWKDRMIALATSTYHPCCGVTVATNDCGHAVALTGLIKKLLQEGKSDQEIRTEEMLWEEYFFPRHYVIMGLALKKAGRPLSNLDLSANYSTVQSERFATDYLIY